MAKAPKIDLHQQASEAFHKALIAETDKQFYENKPCVTTLMKAYDKRRLLGYGGHPSIYRIEGSQVYIATVDPTTGAPVLDVRLIDSLQALYG